MLKTLRGEEFEATSIFGVSRRSAAAKHAGNVLAHAQSTHLAAPNCFSVRCFCS